MALLYVYRWIAYDIEYPSKLSLLITCVLIKQNGQVITEGRSHTPSLATTRRPNTCRRLYHIVLRPVITEFIAGFFHVLIAILAGASGNLVVAAFGAGLSLYVAIAISCDIR